MYKSLLMRGRMKQPNTFIKGVANNTISGAADLAAELSHYPSGVPFLASDIKYFNIVGNDVECYISDWYELSGPSFRNNSNIKAYIDEDENLKSITGFGFQNSGLEYLKDNGLLSIQGYNLSRYSIQKLEIRSLTSLLGTANFYRSYNIQSLYLPNLTNLTNISLELSAGTDPTPICSHIYAPNVTVLGDSVSANNNVFNNLNIDCDVYLDASLWTVNSGNPDPDLQYLIDRGNYVVAVENYTPPNPINDLDDVNIYGTAVEIDFTIPTSTNAIRYYNVLLNGEVHSKTFTKPNYVAGLDLNTSYEITVESVDIYFNSSISNILEVTTASSKVNYRDYIISYLKFNNNYLDSVGSNDGTGSNTTFATGLIDNSAVFNGTSSSVLLPPNIVSSTDYSIAILVKKEDLTTGFQRIIELDDNIGGSYTQIRIRDNVFQFYARDTSGNLGFEDETILPNVIDWNVVVITVSENNELKGYVNGFLIGTVPIGEFELIDGDNNYIGVIRLGNTQFLKGNINAISIFNSILSIQEISDITNKLLIDKEHLI